ncbi:hypothetical protein K503DRAFT_728939 [Rhizopogon vinicolor AM-OR11-026]|uniref:Uncharacterized protein n=1 Tax=Rhizopogon vinicolor AM-OR11-026 TaxID=1314800 RepID=A0A1B7NIB6_9AGAM|nr:hypothetical protein K503DRAFT_728939 [Rhizopogon vinicolor AM-OR11-026]
MPESNKPMRPKVRRYHAYAVVLFIMGTLFPPLAVAARFGIGKDFWLNLLLTICGYIPGHAHNFYIQNIRNNKNNRRTPKWAQRYGLVDTSTIKRHEQRSQWAGRYNDRNAHSALDDQPLEEGEVAPSRSTTQDSPTKPSNGSALWKHGDESFYNTEREGSLRSAESGSSRWHYPANFNDTLPGAGDSSGRKKKKKKDRWARTEDAYTAPEQKKRKKKSKNRSTVGGGGDIESTYSRNESTADLEVPEDAAGGAYGSGRRNGNAAGESGHAAALQGESDDVFNHEF